MEEEAGTGKCSLNVHDLTGEEYSKNKSTEILNQKKKLYFWYSSINNTYAKKFTGIHQILLEPWTATPSRVTHTKYQNVKFRYSMCVTLLGVMDQEPITPATLLAWPGSIHLCMHDYFCQILRK